MKILLAEREPELSKFLKEALESESFAVDVAHGETDSSRLARENEYDLVIFGSSLSAKDGVEACRVMRALGKFAPILILSRKSTARQKVDFLDAGADDYLTKPFALSEFMARVRALLRRPRTIEAQLLQVEDLKLDAQSGQVTRNGAEISLTRKEFMLLQHLMQHAGKIVTRSMLIEHVWDMNADLFSNTVEAHILNLRKKIGDAEGSARLLVTVHGRGYRLG